MESVIAYQKFYNKILKDAIEAKTKVLNDLAQKLGQMGASSGSDAGAQAGASEPKASSHGDDVLDAEFEEVKDDDKK